LFLTIKDLFVVFFPVSLKIRILKKVTFFKFAFNMDLHTINQEEDKVGQSQKFHEALRIPVKKPSQSNFTAANPIPILYRPPVCLDLRIIFTLKKTAIL